MTTPKTESGANASASAGINPARARRTPIRTCVACRTTGGKRGLLRVVRLAAKEGEPVRVVLDPTGKQSGRGAYVCPTPECVALAIKRKALERSLKTPLPADTVLAFEQYVTQQS